MAAVLGVLPLALALAAPVIRGQRHGWAEVRTHCERYPIEVSLTEDNGQPYPQQGVARAVRLSSRRSERPTRRACAPDAVQIMAVLSVAGVRRELLHVAGRAASSSGGGGRAAMVDRVLQWLSDRSLLTSVLAARPS